MFVFVKQFRPPVFLTRICDARGDENKLALGDLNLSDPALVEQGHNLGRLGVTLELCAGIVDKVSFSFYAT